MKEYKKKTPNKTNQKQRPAESPDARENQMIALAVDLAEQQLRDGTASAQVISHYLKLGSSKGRSERAIDEENIKLLRAKTEALQSQKRTEELYAEALAAMRKYSGNSKDEEL